MNIRLSGVLLRFVGYRRQFFVEANTLAAGLRMLAEQQQTLKSVLFDGEGNVRTTHRLFLNGNQLGAADFDKPVNAGDTLEILTALAGG